MEFCWNFFRGVAVTICFICVLTSKLKRGKIHRNIVKSEIPHSKCTTIQYALIICNVSRDSVEQFQRGGDDNYFMWVKFLHSKRRNSQVKLNQKFRQYCTYMQYALHNHKVSRNLVERASEEMR